MADVLRSAQARSDLLEIWLYIAQDSVEAADRMLAAIEQKARILADFPEMGERCGRLAPSLRFFTAGRYVIFYRPVEHGIQIVRVVSGARDMETLFGGGADS
jgi:toxin ParE1/3/4